MGVQLVQIGRRSAIDVALVDGQRITLPLHGPVAHILSGGTLVRTVACPVPQKTGPDCALHEPERRSRIARPNRC